MIETERTPSRPVSSVLWVVHHTSLHTTFIITASQLLSQSANDGRLSLYFWRIAVDGHCYWPLPLVHRCVRACVCAGGRAHAADNVLTPVWPPTFPDKETDSPTYIASHCVALRTGICVGALHHLSTIQGQERRSMWDVSSKRLAPMRGLWWALDFVSV